MQRLRRLARQAVSRIEKPFYRRGLFAVSKLTRPDFLGIGAMKSGTTWLYENLRCHPDAYLPDRKELYYFSYGFYDGRFKTYLRNFQDGADKIKGEITPGYATIPEDRIRFIRKVLPNVKLIFIARNPVYRSWSEAHMNLAVKAGRDISDLDESDIIEYLTTGDCRHRSDYLRILDNWHRVFPSSQFFLGTLDEIQQSPSEFLVRLFRFLNLSTEIDLSCFPSNNIVRPRYEANRMVYRGEVADTAISSSSLIPDNIRRLLRNLYAPQIERLAQAYDLQTENWG